MTTPQGLVTFPGVTQILRADFTLTQGIHPSVATVEILPQLSLVPEVGTLSFAFDQTLILFPNSRVEAAFLKRTSQGLIWSMQITDRRWKWQFGEISGRYNTRNADGSLDSGTEKTPQELATLLLTALNEINFDVSLLPNDTRPEVEWIAANPAQQLATLCDRLGCRVVLSLNNTVEIHVTGVGAVLPTVAALNQSYSIQPPKTPDQLKVVAGPTKFQRKLELEAVGLDTDNQLKPIEDLSYKPSLGWETQHPESFAAIEDETSRSLALQTVFRWYRIKQASLTVPEAATEVNQLFQILPLEKTLIKTQLDEDNLERPQPARVEGVYWPGYHETENTPEGTAYDGAFSLDCPRGVVQFALPVVKLNAAGENLPAELYLETSFHVKDLTNRQFERFSLELNVNVPPQGTGAHILRREEIVRTIEVIYDPAQPMMKTGENDNQAEVTQQAQHDLNASLVEFQIPAAQDIEYAGLIPLSPDGAIQQVTWSVSRQGTKTRASSNTEHDLHAPSFQEKRRRIQLEQLQQRPQLAEEF